MTNTTESVANTVFSNHEPSTVITYIEFNKQVLANILLKSVSYYNQASIGSKSLMNSQLNS